jgi:hypothetical protein
VRCRFKSDLPLTALFRQLLLHVGALLLLLLLLLLVGCCWCCRACVCRSSIRVCYPTARV